MRHVVRGLYRLSFLQKLHYASLSTAKTIQEYRYGSISRAAFCLGRLLRPNGHRLQHSFTGDGSLEHHRLDPAQHQQRGRVPLQLGIPCANIDALFENQIGKRFVSRTERGMDLLGDYNIAIHLFRREKVASFGRLIISYHQGVFIEAGDIGDVGLPPSMISC